MFYKVFTPAVCPTLVDSRPLPTLDGVDSKHPLCPQTFYKVFTPAVCPTLVDSRPLPTLDGVDSKRPLCPQTFYKVFTPAVCPTLVDSRPLPTLDGVDSKHPLCSLANVHLSIRTPPTASLLNTRTAIAPLPQLDDVVDDAGRTLHPRPKYW
jgi:hypothetical protein